MIDGKKIVNQKITTKKNFMRLIYSIFPNLKDEEVDKISTLDEFIDKIKGKAKDADEIQATLIKILDRAYDIRKFEIDLYWKRAAYFWGFMIAIFAAYFIVIDPTKKISPLHQCLIPCLGFIFSLSWYLVNRGSGYWLTHWERIIDAVETYLSMSLYKANLQESKPYRLDSNYPHSVSRINLIVSLSICIVWSLLTVKIFFNHKLNIEMIILLIATLFVAYWLIVHTKSSKGKNEFYYFYERGLKYGAASNSHSTSKKE